MRSFSSVCGCGPINRKIFRVCKPKPSQWASQERLLLSPDSRGRRISERRAAWTRPALFPLALITALFANVQAWAQQYPARDIGGWTVAASKDKKGCFVTRQYAGPGSTTLLLGLDIDGTNHLSVLNDNWSIKPKDKLKLNFRLTTGGYSDHFAVGIAADGKKGFVTDFEEKFPVYFASSKALHISRGEVPVEQLSLDGSGAAVAEMRRCLWIHRSTAKAPEKQRASAIPKDPFAPGPVRKSKD